MKVVYMCPARDSTRKVRKKGTQVLLNQDSKWMLQRCKSSENFLIFRKLEVLSKVSGNLFCLTERFAMIGMAKGGSVFRVINILEKQKRQPGSHLTPPLGRQSWITKFQEIDLYFAYISAM